MSFPLIQLLQISFSMWEVPLGIKIRAFSFFYACPQMSTRTWPQTCPSRARPTKEELDVNLNTYLRLNQDSIYSIKNLSEKSPFPLPQRQSYGFPIFHRGFWLKYPLEAASHSCPIISTRTGAIQELLGNYCHFVDPNSQQIINQTVIELLKSNDRRKLNLELPTPNDCKKILQDV